MTLRDTASGTTLWRTLRQYWCRHRFTIITPKTDAMPAHTVCQSCGWREPIIGARPTATRTWDSTRDDARYEREKKRRAAAEHQRQLALAQLATPGESLNRPKRTRQTNVVEMKRAAGD